MAFNEARTDLILTLYDGEVHEIQGDRLGGFQRLYFTEQVVPLRGVGDELDRRMGGADRGDREMTFRMLRDNAAERRAELVELSETNRTRAAEAVRLALARPAEGDSAAVANLRMRQARGQVAQLGTNRSVLSRDAVTQNVISTTRTHLSREGALEEQVHRLTVELQKKWAIAFACLVFTLIGPPLALRFPRGGVGMVVAASTVIFAIYWVGLIGGEKLADRRVGDPIFTMWIPNIVFFVVGLALLSRMGRAGGTVRGGGGLDELVGRLLAPLRRREEARAAA